VIVLGLVGTSARAAVTVLADRGQTRVTVAAPVISPAFLHAVFGDQPGLRDDSVEAAAADRC